MPVVLKPVKSSNILAIGHDPERQELHVKFRTGPDVYFYHPVTAEEHEALLAAESIGSHFHRHIKGPKTGRKL